MKKLLAIVLLICIIISFSTACNKAEAIGSAEKDKTVVTTEEAVSAVAEQSVVPTVEVAAAPENPQPTAPVISKAEIAKKVDKKSLEPIKTAEPVKTTVQAKTTEPTTAAQPVIAEAKIDTVTFTDSLGKTITIKKNPQRVVCLYTSYLDVWDLAGGKVVGRPDTKESVPAAAKDAETIGLYTTPNLEKIMILQPDLVLLNSDVNAQVMLIPILEKKNISYAALKYDTFKDYANMLHIFTGLTEREDIYQTKGIDVAKKIDAIIAKVPRDRKPSILLLLGSSKSVSVRLPDTTVGEMLKDLGTVNIAYDANASLSDMQVFSMEKVIEKNPDFIFVQSMGDIEETNLRVKKDIESNPAWGYLDAVKSGRYIFLPKDLYLFKPNDRYAEAYEKLAKRIYPDIFLK